MSGSGGNKRDKDEKEGSSSSTLEKIGVAAAAGAAVVWGLSKFMSSSADDDRKQEPNLGSNRSYATTASPWSGIFQRPTYKLNFDGSESNQKDTAGAGFIIRKQSTGEPVISGYYNLNHLYLEMCDILVATAMGLKLGLEMAKKEGIQLSFIQGNRTDVIKWVKGEKPEAKYVKLMEEIKQLMKECGIHPYQIEEVDGEKYNKVASELAELGRIWAKPDRIFRGSLELPEKVSKLIDEDM